jgi:hypothetical protein
MDTPKCISSRDSQAGHWLLRLLDGPPTDPSGRGRARVNPSPPQERARASGTSATSGPSSTTSSPPAARPSSSENRSPARRSSEELQSRLNEILGQRMSQCGSMEYSLTSKEHLTPARRRIFRLRASAHRTSANASGGVPYGYPTPRAEDSESSGMRYGRGAADTLAAVASPTGWATTTRDHKDTVGMATTGTNPDGSERSRLDQLGRQVGLVTGWPSAIAGDQKRRVSTESASLRRIASGKQISIEVVACLTLGLTSESSHAATGNFDGFQLNPLFSLWLMGYSPEWGLIGLLSLNRYLSKS